MLFRIRNVYSARKESLRGRSICRLKTAGRAKTAAFASAYGEAGSNGTVPYYLATAFEKVGV